MTIKEVEQYLEVPRATVRFYEKEGLINPERGNNGYRDYSEEDVERLRKIIIFRKLGMTLTDIADAEGNLAVSVPMAILEVFVMALTCGLVCCIFKGWSSESLLEGIGLMIKVLIVELVVSIPIFFMSRKNPDILKKKNRDKVKFKIMTGLMILCILIIVLSSIFGW